MLVTSALVAAQDASDESLTSNDVIASLPTDPGSIFALLLVFGSFALIVWAGRSQGQRGPRQ